MTFQIMLRPRFGSSGLFAGNENNTASDAIRAMSCFVREKLCDLFFSCSSDFICSAVNLGSLVFCRIVQSSLF